MLLKNVTKGLGMLKMSDTNIKTELVWEDLLNDRFCPLKREVCTDETPHLIQFSKLEAVSDLFYDEAGKSR